MNDFATRLRQMMVYKGIRQSDIVEKTGIEKGKVSRYVNGKNLPSAEMLVRIARMFDVSPSWLIGEEESHAAAEEPGEPSGSSPVIAEVITSEELDLIIRYRKADKRARRPPLPLQSPNIRRSISRIILRNQKRANRPPSCSASSWGFSGPINSMRGRREPEFCTS